MGILVGIRMGYIFVPFAVLPNGQALSLTLHSNVGALNHASCDTFERARTHAQILEF